jgi:hypothetical protein
MGIFLWFLKPLLYLAAFALGAKWFARSGPHHPQSVGVVVLVATVARVVAGGVGGGIAAVASGGNKGVFYAVLLVCGLASWFAVAALAFKKSPKGAIFLFALCTEAVSITIDALAATEAGHFNFC